MIFEVTYEVAGEYTTVVVCSLPSRLSDSERAGCAGIAVSPAGSRLVSVMVAQS